MLTETIKAVHAAGFRFMLVEDSRAWSAIALGPTADPRYTRAIGFGQGAEEAMQNLIIDLKEVTKPEAPKVEDDYSDLV